MSFHQLKKIVGNATKVVADGEKLSVAMLASRARKVAEAHPYDNTSVGMSNFLSKRASAGNTFITRAELRGVYHRLYTQNNKFCGSFSEELGLSELSGPKFFPRHANEHKDLVKEAMDKMADQHLTHTLTSLFDKDTKYTPYTPQIAKNASTACLQELNQFAAPKKVEVVAGQEDLLICKATFETPKGQSSVYIPVEISEGNPLLPTMMLSQGGMVDLNEQNLVDHVVKVAGKNLSVDTQKMLSVLDEAKNGKKEAVSEIEMIIAKAKIASGESAYTADGILYQELDKVQEPVQYEDQEEVLEFGAKLASPKGGAEFMFGKDAVDTARKLVVKAMKDFGFKNVNTNVTSSDDSKIYFAVSLGNQGGFNVAVPVVNNKPSQPKVIVASAGIFDFNRNGISELLAFSAPDTKAIAAASPLYSLSSSALVEKIRTAMVDGNQAVAEDALNVLKHSGDVSSYQAGFAAYVDGLGGKVAEASGGKCSLQRKVAYSSHVLCGHTNLPLHKVYQDEHGDCRPLYRKSQPEAETALPLTSKVYFT